MRAVYKYPVPVDDSVTIEIPSGSRILTVQFQEPHGYPYLWALVNPSAPPEMRHFMLVGTGDPIETSDDLLYIGTFQLRGGTLVYHLFETKGRRL